MKVIKSLKKRGNLSKGTTRKNLCQPGRFLNFFRPLMTAGLAFMSFVLVTIVDVLRPFGLSA